MPTRSTDGCRADLAATSIADGAIVGTYFTEGGVFENRAVRSRVIEPVEQARKFRNQLV